jgi:hypothetical protein
MDHDHGKKDAIYHKPKRAHDFVDYFFQKQKEGESYLALLTKVRTQCEKLCNELLPNAGSKIKKKAGEFLLKIHDARKVQPDVRGVDIPRLQFAEELEKCFSGLEGICCADDGCCLISPGVPNFHPN